MKLYPIGPLREVAPDVSMKQIRALFGWGGLGLLLAGLVTMAKGVTLP